MRRLDQQGFDHTIVAVFCVVAVALVGTAMLVASHAYTIHWKGALEEGSSSSGFCLTTNGAVNGSTVALDPCNSTASSTQSWSLNYTGHATVLGTANVQEFTLQSANGTTECLNDPSGSKSNGVALQLYTCHSSDPNNLWVWGGSITGKGLAYHQLVNVASVSGSSALCLDDAYGSHAAATKVQLWSCKTAERTNQSWYEQASPGVSGGGTGSSNTTYLYSHVWSGYLATSGSFTSVSGAWIATNPKSDGASDSVDGSWIGIGGWVNHNNNLIQVGTYNDVSANGQVTPGAFYELLNSSATDSNINMTVSPGDAMSAKVSEVSSGEWQINLTDITRREVFNKTVSYNSALSSAEWIEEDPYDSGSNTVTSPFDLFGSVRFTSASATMNGTAQTLKSAGSQPVIMQNPNNKAIATPSAIGADGESFTVTGGG